ncbi:hypothetical protein FDA94_29695 [Herbidospora galbida]|uniref:Uncharacterized protein n=1 Tax=Herbidospora galbida TaxID=2575442 RepID=A0A4U3M8Z8_9ACTN|nr:hypothetical protein [Herbidospora galbida]TKK84514.1 hypothetical protein FDA94_29695 [Herbidospora galbida]
MPSRALITRLPLVLLLVSCSVFGGFEGRAHNVAASWQGSAADRAWRTGFVPLEVLNPQGWARVGRVPRWAARSAHNRIWRLATTLPAQTPPPAAVRWPDGSVSHVPLVPAAAEFAAFSSASHLIEDPCPPGECRPLVITGVTLGEVPLETSRGVVQVPAWRFAVEGVDQPFVRVAVDPSAVTERPRRAKGDVREVHAFDLVAGKPKALSVRYGFGACEDVTGVPVYETGQVVVVGVESTPTGDGACPAILKLGTAEVTLARPLGDRVVLDAGSGLPLPPGLDRPWD